LREIILSKCVGGFGEKKSNSGTQYYQQNRVYSIGDLALAMPAQLPYGSYNYLEIKRLKEIKELEQKCVAMRGRNPENPSDRRPGIELEQRLEINETGTTNALTTVQKDNLILEKQHKNFIENITGKIKIKQATKQGFIECEIGGVCNLDYPTSQTRRGRVEKSGQISPTLTTENIPNKIELGNPDFYNFLYEIDGEIYLIRIRKLIPLECWRLMGFTDEDFYKAEKVNSNTQLYKQAGNSIVVNCLEAIISQMNIKGVPAWNKKIESENRG